MRKSVQNILSVLVLMLFSSGTLAADKPNILVIWGDDIGQSNISVYTHGMMGELLSNVVFKRLNQAAT